MLQRSPTYIVAMPDRDPIADLILRRLPSGPAFRLLRWKNLLLTMAGYRMSRRWPNVASKVIRRGAQRRLPADFDVDTTIRCTDTSPGCRRAWRYFPGID